MIKEYLRRLETKGETDREEARVSPLGCGFEPERRYRGQNAHLTPGEETGVKRLLLYQEILVGRKKCREQELYDTRSGLDEEQGLCLL